MKKKCYVLGGEFWWKESGDLWDCRDAIYFFLEINKHSQLMKLCILTTGLSEREMGSNLVSSFQEEKKKNGKIAVIAGQ